MTDAIIIVILDLLLLDFKSITAREADTKIEVAWVYTHFWFVEWGCFQKQQIVEGEMYICDIFHDEYL